MADNFCTQCGERLRPQARFCTRCGASSAAFPEQPGALRGSRISMPSLSMPPLEDIVPGLLRGQGSREEQVAPWGLMTKDLDYLVGCSFSDAILDAAFLLARDSSGLARWMPTTLIRSMQGLTVLAYAVVYYHLGDEYPYPFLMFAALADPMPDEVSNALTRPETPGVVISISLQYKPVDYGELTGKITGRWASAADEQGLPDVRAILQMPFSGYILKQRLLAWEARILSFMEEACHGAPMEEQAESIRVMQRELRSLINKIPDGFADHIYCVARVMERDKEQPTVHSNPPEDMKKAALHPDSGRRILNALGGRGEGFFKRRPIKSSRARPLESSLVRGFGPGSGRDAAARVKGYIRSDL